MNKLIFAAIITTIVYGCDNKDKKTGAVTEKPGIKTDSKLVTDSSWGLINKNTDFAGLQNIYGNPNVKDERICGPECIDSLDVTIIFPGKDNEFIVYWEDSLYHKKIGLIRCYADDAPYHTTKGIKMGTTLSELLSINGKPIAFFGFGWDYGGSVISLNHGVLEETNIRFTLDLTESGDDNSLSGDTELNSEMPAVKKVQDKIRVSELLLPLNR